MLHHHLVVTKDQVNISMYSPCMLDSDQKLARWSPGNYDEVSIHKLNIVLEGW